MRLNSQFRFGQYALAAFAAAFSACSLTPLALAQASPNKDASANALADALSAACRQDQAAFATHLTADNAEAYRNLPAPRRSAFIKRFVLLEDPGKPLLTSTSDGHPDVRCEAAGVISEMRFGATQLRDNLAFIRVEVPQAGRTDDEVQNVRFGLVREGAEWKLLSVGLLLIDIAGMQRDWDQSDLASRESEAIAALRKIAWALKGYQEAFGKLPDSLDQLGPPPSDNDLSPEKAGLIENQLASGENASYQFRYTIAAANVPGDESDRDKAAGFFLAATPLDYGKTGRRSFYLDSTGVLRGDDKHGAVATIDDPEIGGDTPP